MPGRPIGVDAPEKDEAAMHEGVTALFQSQVQSLPRFHCGFPNDAIKGEPLGRIRSIASGARYRGRGISRCH